MKKRPFEITLETYNLVKCAQNKSRNDFDINNEELDLLTNAYSKLHSRYSSNKVILNSGYTSPTNFHVNLSKEEYTSVVSSLKNVFPNTNNSLTISNEFSLSTRQQLEVCNEGIGDFLSKIWEKIKAFFRKILEFFGFGSKETEAKAEKTEKKVKKAKKKIAEATNEVKEMEIPILITQDTVKLLPAPAKPETKKEEEKIEETISNVDGMGIFAYVLSHFKHFPKALTELCDINTGMKDIEEFMNKYKEVEKKIKNETNPVKLLSAIKDFDKYASGNFSQLISLISQAAGSGKVTIKGIDVKEGNGELKKTILNSELLSVQPYSVRFIKNQKDDSNPMLPPIPVIWELVFDKEAFEYNEKKNSKIKIKELNKILDILSTIKKDDVKIKNVKIEAKLNEYNKCISDFTGSMNEETLNKIKNDPTLAIDVLNKIPTVLIKFITSSVKITGALANYRLKSIVNANEKLSSYVNNLIDIANKGNQNNED